MTSIGFTGQRADSVSGLDYYVARHYDPVVGQFLSADVKQGNVAGMDPYAYVGGNPESRTDPSGQRYACGPSDPSCSVSGKCTSNCDGGGSASTGSGNNGDTWDRPVTSGSAVTVVVRKMALETARGLRMTVAVGIRRSVRVAHLIQAPMLERIVCTQRHRANHLSLRKMLKKVAMLSLSYN